jgi:hypothetical protein
MSLLTRRGTRRPTSSDSVLRADHALVVKLLESADGRWLSYGALEAQGVTNPALAGYELAAAGWEIRPAVVTDPEGHRHVGLRLTANGNGASPTQR